jgi:hypothetical protein
LPLEMSKVFLLFLLLIVVQTVFSALTRAPTRKPTAQVRIERKRSFSITKMPRLHSLNDHYYLSKTHESLSLTNVNELHH